MATDVASELEQFQHFVSQTLASGGATLSPEEVLDAWRIANPNDEELTASVADLRQALEEADRGEGIPLDQALTEIRHKHRLPNPASHG
ncbi:MAG: hypothetical protein HZA46_16075 [Planctomycetales bacterium]|nr:hypothetical protein [Planctomycetales bacterium]